MKKILSLVLILMLALIPMAVADEFNPADYPVAICMDSMNHPVHRIVQLGFLKAAEALGYTDAKVIGTEGGDTSEAFAAAEAFALDGGKGLLGDEAGKVSLVPGGLPGAIQLGGLLAKLLFPRRQSRRSLAQRQVQLVSAHSDGGQLFIETGKRGG